MLRMTRWTLACSVSLLTLACGGSSPPPESPAAPGANTPTGGDAPAAPAAAATDKPASDGWEGEGDAKVAGPGPAAGGDAKPAATGSGQPETRTIEVIQRIVKEHRAEVRECYDKARKDLPSLQGDMMIHFVLDPEGKIKTIELNQERSTLKAPPVVDCAIKVLKGLQFPPSSRGMESQVNYPYNFMPGGPPQR
jgi:hypothetical protein